MKKLRTGVIGCGKVGDFHARAYGGLEQSQFCAVCDTDQGRAEAFAGRWGASGLIPRWRTWWNTRD